MRAHLRDLKSHLQRQNFVVMHHSKQANAVKIIIERTSSGLTALYRAVGTDTDADVLAGYVNTTATICTGRAGCVNTTVTILTQERYVSLQPAWGAAEYPPPRAITSMNLNLVEKCHIGPCSQNCHIPCT